MKTKQSKKRSLLNPFSLYANLEKDSEDSRNWIIFYLVICAIYLFILNILFIPFFLILLISSTLCLRLTEKSNLDPTFAFLSPLLFGFVAPIGLWAGLKLKKKWNQLEED